jgi:hypothetical protein
MQTSINIHSILASYPRKRPPLTPAHQKIYVTDYKQNRQGSRAVDGLVQKVEAWMHHQIATQSSGDVLELGAGTLNHVRYEEKAAAYDIVEPFTELYKDNSQLSKVRTIYGSLSAIPPSNKYSRVISTATLEHMTNLPFEIALSAEHMDTHGIFQASIPSEGGFLWWLGWRCTTGISYWLRNRLNYGVIMRHEHINKAEEIIELLGYVFEKIKIKRFPTPFHTLSLYTYIEATKPRTDRVRHILNTQRNESI